MLEAETPSFDSGSLRLRFPGNTMSQSQVHAAEKQAFRKRRRQLRLYPTYVPVYKQFRTAAPWAVGTTLSKLGSVLPSSLPLRESPGSTRAVPAATPLVTVSSPPAAARRPVGTASPMALPGLAVLLILICCSMTTDHGRKSRREMAPCGAPGSLGLCSFSVKRPSLRSRPHRLAAVRDNQPLPIVALFSANLAGNPRAAADNLTCRVHDVDQLSCSWAVGEEAPADVQYQFYLKQSVETWQCPKYTQNQQGVNVQCHFDSISLQPQRQAQFRFLVNGTSGDSEIPCRVMIHRLQEIEILAAPNITKKWCNENDSFMEWEVRSLFTEDIKYELEIQKGTDLAYKEETELKSLRLRNPGPYTVKVKAMDSLFFGRRPPGQWSAPQHLDCGGKNASFPFWLVYLLAPLGALLLVGLVFLCRSPCALQMAWDPEQESQEECPVVQVQVLGEA
ncbi:hypothetical protein AB1E18_019578 [Capra hircus]